VGEKVQDTAETPGYPRLKKAGKIMLILAVVGVCTWGVQYYLFFSPHGPFELNRLIQERDRLEQENARLAEENTRLARTIIRLQNDPAMIMDLIRRELNFIRKNEVILQLPPKPGTQAVTASILPDKPSPPPAAKPGSGSVKGERKGQKSAKKNL
jgi:cell division protein FtsB